MKVKEDSGRPPVTKQATKKQTILNRLYCATLEGMEAQRVEVEATFTRGLPTFTVVGLANSDIQEAKERVKSALLVNGFSFPPLKITIGLSPSELRKSGSQFDLSLALLIAMYERAFEEEGLYVFGELGLDGKVKSSSMLFPLILSLKERGVLKRAIVPQEAMVSLRHISGVAFYPVATLLEAITLLTNGSFTAVSMQSGYEGKRLEIEGSVYYYCEEYERDFLDVKGQEVAKRAGLIASAGMHNFFMEGNPGSGKSMIAKRLRDILPPLDEASLLQIARHQFLEGTAPSFKPIRPMRSPHHTATSASIFGGGSQQAKIGEVALANKGILFFDELPHFSKKVLEALREPLQDKVVNISRVHSKISYEADMMFVTAQNPCPCGNLLSQTEVCRCSASEIQRYQNRISDPLLDRMDIFVVMQEVSASDSSSLSSAQMHQAVIEAFKVQKRRGQVRLNGKLTESEVEQFCLLTQEAMEILEKAISRFGLSHRAIDSLKRVSRTIADLAGEAHIGRSAMLEALSYRRRR
jgi:magnesium chelatase family protein